MLRWGAEVGEFIRGPDDLAQAGVGDDHDATARGYTAHMGRPPQDSHPSPGRVKTHWDHEGVVFELDVLKHGVLLIRMTVRPEDPQGRLVPVGMAIQGPDGESS